ncbi:MAG: PAS domain S-box protein, partial [Chloroflexi bacterium]|nr:PAS domain S-box protein [Chloroflexota bacterium]
GGGGGPKTQRILLAIEDITERKVMEKELTSSELRYRRLFETAQDGILLLDAQTGQITDVNPFLLKMLGYSKQDLSGKKLWEIGFFKDAEASRQAFRVLQDKGYIRYEDLPLETRDGQPMYVEFVSNVYSINGEKVIQCNIRDITGRKEMQDKLVAYERLAAIGELSGGIAHELRNPLATLDSSIFLLKKILPDTDERVKTHLERMKASVKSCVNIIDSLLNLTQMREPNRQMHDLRKVVAALLSSRDVPRGVNVVQEFPAQSVMIKVDRYQLDIALGNIVTNALQALDGTGELRAVMRTDDGTAELAFIDDGPGIARENLNKMFQPLFTTKAKGIGLGLVITRMIVEKHGGTIQVKSEPGQGATFIVKLPLLTNETTEQMTTPGLEGA